MTRVKKNANLYRNTQSGDGFFHALFAAYLLPVT